ncbi:TBC1 domain family member 10B [Smittium culicis]|uniref:TBC1 domain family member 10B n=1 Tax=Smittium culicis TaxID=133412 RepID=A0A1R1XLI4_9FUNG|nr:TBC1 domain family member 10B [Smittium culicis]OMJ24365.1 TBC1 domain family member 10B [Smittium culicis]
MDGLQLSSKAELKNSSTDLKKTDTVQYNSSKYIQFDGLEQSRFLENKDFDLKFPYQNTKNISAEEITPSNNDNSEITMDSKKTRIVSNTTPNDDSQISFVPAQTDNEFLKFAENNDHTSLNSDIASSNNDHISSNTDTLQPSKENSIQLSTKRSSIMSLAQNDSIIIDDYDFIPLSSPNNTASRISTKDNDHNSKPHDISDSPSKDLPYYLYLEDSSPFQDQSTHDVSKRGSNVYSIGKLAYLAKHKSRISSANYSFSPAFSKALENASLVSDYLSDQKKSLYITTEMLRARDKFLDSSNRHDLINLPDSYLSPLSSFKSVNKPFNSDTSSLSNSKDSQIKHSPSFKQKSNTPLLNRPSKKENGTENKLSANNLSSLKLDQPSPSNFSNSSYKNSHNPLSSPTNSSIPPSNADFRLSFYLDNKFKRLQVDTDSTNQVSSSIFSGSINNSSDFDLKNIPSNIKPSSKALFSSNEYSESEITGFKIQSTVSNILLRAGLSSVALKMAQSNLKRGVNKPNTQISNNSTVFNSNADSAKPTLPSILLNSNRHSSTFNNTSKKSFSVISRNLTEPYNTYPHTPDRRTHDSIINSDLYHSKTQQSAPLDEISHQSDGLSDEIVERPTLISSDFQSNLNNIQSQNMTVSEMRAMRLMYVDYIDAHGFLVFKNKKDSNKHEIYLNDIQASLSSIPHISSVNNVDSYFYNSSTEDNKLVDKWTTILTMFPFESIKKSRKFQKLAQKGFPDSIRAQVYWCLMGVKKSYIKILNGKTFEQEYQNLVDMDISLLPKVNEAIPKNEANSYAKLAEVIERDLSRSFPNHAMFYDESCGGQSCLRRILTAYLKYNPEVGYCQGMNLLAGLLLIVGMPEVECFWTLSSLLDTYLINYFTPDLSMIQIHSGVFEMLLSEHNPKLAAHLEKQGCEPLMYLTPWFMTAFTMSLPWKSVLRVWDWFIFRGPKVLFRVAIGIMDILSDYLLNKCSTLELQLQYVLHIPHDLLGPDELIRASNKVKISTKTIQKYSELVSKKKNIKMP